MTRARRSLWQASVVCLFLSVILMVGIGAITANNPLDGGIASDFGTNNGTALQVMTRDAAGNMYWANAQTNSGGGGSGFPLTKNESFDQFGVSNVGFVIYTTNTTLPAAVSNAIITYAHDRGAGEVGLAKVSWIQTNAPVTNFSRTQ